MATVVRIKRRRNDDHLDILFLSSKKAKTDVRITEETVCHGSESFLKFAGRVNSKDAGISKHVREAIRKEKLEKEYKRHEGNTFSQVKQQSRRNQRCLSQQSRYKITAKHRAIDLELLDFATDTYKDNAKTDRKIEQDETKTEESCAKVDKEKTEEKTIPAKSVVPENQNVSEDVSEQETDNILCECDRTDSCQCQINGNKNVKHKVLRKFTGVEVKPKSKHKMAETENCTKTEVQKTGESPPRDDNKMFCLVDVEAEYENTLSHESLTTTSNQILCNGVPLEKEIVTERDSDDSFVYDLYYTNSRDFNFRLLENFLTVEAFGEDYRTAEEDEEDGNHGNPGYEDEDSNDEGNWRNDYPDEDPGFIENQDMDYYGNDLDENLAFETETGNQLADWMSWRCNIENEAELSSEDEVDAYETGARSYEAYYSRVRKEVEGDSDSEDYD